MQTYAAGSIGDEWIKTPQPASGTSGAMARGGIANVPKTMWDPSDSFAATARPEHRLRRRRRLLAYCQFHGRASGTARTGLDEQE